MQLFSIKSAKKATRPVMENMDLTQDILTVSSQYPKTWI